jgi:hypothetical protein
LSHLFNVEVVDMLRNLRRLLKKTFGGRRPAGSRFARLAVRGLEKREVLAALT